MAKNSSNPDVISGLLGVGSHFHGRINFNGTLRIDGVVCGEIISKKSKKSVLIITETAQVEADIIADIVIVSGMVSGNIKAIERLELHSPGRVEGMVYTSDFYIQDGALFQGECITIRHLSAEEKEALKLEGFYNIHSTNVLTSNRKAIQNLLDY
ncbi:MAG: polymer-forming cytoskeletal protein [Bacteroidetes bacterium]|jgi:cytoskeletal protein CcmA (bactofilin family)|nr:polymer-forming cytoskeletal protein [Bacteroidota bacterium]MBT4286955.1 polymer-forming cytoskeletal protein [Deltaproteobacteria bacterium]MBT4526136.1 polymer-forming cytoskeletal protein [Deltaproteobacteria bacterium]